MAVIVEKDTKPTLFEIKAAIRALDMLGGFAFAGCHLSEIAEAVDNGQAVVLKCLGWLLENCEEDSNDNQ